MPLATAPYRDANGDDHLIGGVAVGDVFVTASALILPDGTPVDSEHPLPAVSS